MKPASDSADRRTTRSADLRGIDKKRSRAQGRDRIRGTPQSSAVADSGLTKLDGSRADEELTCDLRVSCVAQQPAGGTTVAVMPAAKAWNALLPWCGLNH